MLRSLSERVRCAAAKPARAERQHGLRRTLDLDARSGATIGDHAHPSAPRIERERYERRLGGNAEAFGTVPQRAFHGVGCERVAAIRHHLGQAPKIRFAAPWLARPAGGPQLNHLHPVLREGAGLVRADHRRRSQRLDRGESFDQRARPGELPHADGESEGDGGQQALGNVRHQQADSEDDGVREGQPGEQAERQEQHPHGHRDGGDHPGTETHLAFQRALPIVPPL